MRRRHFTLAEIAMIGGTRLLLSAGLGLLLARKLSDKPRRATGWTLFSIGLLSTIPLAMKVLNKPAQDRLRLY